VPDSSRWRSRNSFDDSNSLREAFVLASAWLFIVAVAAFDCRFALRHADSFGSWEMNPAMAMLGAYGAVAYRLASVLAGFVVVMSATAWTRMAATIFLFLAHLALALHYLSAWPLP